MQFIKQLFSTSKVPYASGKEKLTAIALAFLVGKVCDIMVSVCKGLLRDFNLPYNIASPVHSASSVGSNSAYLFFLICYAATYEEVTFRLHLKPSNFNFTLSLSLLTVLVIKVIFRDFIELYFSIEILNYCRDIILIVLFYLILKLALRNLDYSQFYSNNKKTIYYSSIVLWVVFHFRNFENVMAYEFVPVILLAIINLFWYGVLFSHLRMAGGILVAIIFHIITNVVKLMV
jgi:hypothetical protein